MSEGSRNCNCRWQDTCHKQQGSHLFTDVQYTQGFACLYCKAERMTAGGMHIVTSRRGPSLHVSISSAPDSPADSSDSTAESEQILGPQQTPLQLEVACKCLQVSFWDDERRIIVGPLERGLASCTAHEQEVLCLSVDGLSASATLSQPGSEPHLTCVYLSSAYGWPVSLRYLLSPRL